MKPLKALWKTLEAILLSLGGGLTGAQISLYLLNQTSSNLLILGTFIIWGGALLIAYICAPDELA